MLGWLSAREKFAAWIRARFPVPSWTFRLHTFGNRERERSRRVRQIATHVLQQESRGVAASLKVGDGREHAYRLRKDA